ncbi:MAG TPA: D-alanyl-D-alanine carboxypeptidase/D-alanyl-D-alanine-endopeptidase [Burkholderiales bacterium]|nr:D-alanyl-D-alanine carboxypeptidase/D-alanyl-D-alanine-endopeptidase [Burkholderiales bacterium]
MPAVFKGCALLLALACFAAQAAGLPAPVRRALSAAGIPQASAHVVVQELGPGRTRLSFNAGAPVNPASVMKLVTTYAALELLGPAYRWRTEVYADGEDLVLRGYGDPKLDYESFWMLLRNLRGRGVRDLHGDLVLDRSYFGAVANGRVDNDVFRPYNVDPDALLVNFKSIRFVFLPEAGGVRVFAEPSPPGLELINALKPGAGSCPEGRAFRDLIQASFQSAPPRAAFTGLYPAECGERDLNAAIYEPEHYLAGVFRLLWSEMGGTWTGSVRNGAVPPGARLLYTHESAPLAQVVRDINKFSNNVMARQLYLTLAAEMGGPPADPARARQSVQQWLELKKIRAPELVIDNGSGLSRIERASAATIAALLQAAWRSRVMPEFVASLPVVAMDGTMRKRLLGERVAGHAHIKTGLLQDARSIAGYVLDRHGRRHAVVMIVNHPRAGESQEALDALLTWVYEGASAMGRPTGRAGPRAGLPGGGPRGP